MIPARAVVLDEAPTLAWNGQVVVARVVNNEARIAASRLSASAAMDILDRPSDGDVDCVLRPLPDDELSEIKPDGDAIVGRLAKPGFVRPQISGEAAKGLAHKAATLA